MANRKVPSQSASGRDTFNDNLVGNQITDGSSQLTATNFSLEKSIPQRDTKSFKSVPFSDFLTLDDLKEETSGNTSTQITQQKKKNEVKFRTARNIGATSLYGSLKRRISTGVKSIIEKFPAGFYVDKDTPVSSTLYTAENISYDVKTNITTFKFEKSKVFNPMDIILEKPKSNTQPEVVNEFKNFFDTYKKYTLSVDNKTYDIVYYTEVGTDGFITLKVKGKPFSSTTHTESYLIRPIDSIVEEFYAGLNDVESLLLDRESTPKYTAIFKLPQDSLDGSKTETTTTKVTWPIFRDGWNIKIGGSEYVSYLEKLSTIAEEVDQYKSNLISRFLTTASLSEFDTEDRRMSSIFQIQGAGFDSVKKFIDNIAYMRNVSYDRINNIPDTLLKNLSNTLGLDSVNLFDEKTLEDTLYSRVDSQFDGVGLGMNLVEAETEFYRRLVINLVRIYKSKGTRKSIEFFLRFIGAPEPLIKINEYVYGYDKVKKSVDDIDSDIYDLTQLTKTFTIGELNSSLFNYDETVTTGSTIFDTDEYPITLTGTTIGDVQPIVSEDNNVFFQKGAGWYEETLQHRSSLEFDTEKSDLTVNPKIIKTKNKDFTYGEDYFDLHRQFYGLDYGYELHNKVDNDKTELIDDGQANILNRKNIQIYLSSAQGIDYDVYRQSRDLEVTFGTNTLPPQTGFTFAEYIEHVLNEQIRNSHTVKYQKSYIQLQDIYQSYLETVPNPYSFPTVNEFINRMSPHWVEIIEQFVPATTLWTGGNIIENSRIGRSKHDYEKPCRLTEFTQNIFPEFENAIEEDLETILGDKDVFRGLTVISGVTYTLHIDFNGETFSGSGSVVLSGETQNVNSLSCETILQNHTHAGLFEPFNITSECTTIETADFNGVQFDKTIHLPLLCDFKCYLEPQREILDCLWTQELESILNDINTKYYKRTLYGGYDNISHHAGWFEYTTGNTETDTNFINELNLNNESYGYEIAPLLSYEIFTDSDGIKKISIIPLKYDTQLYMVNPNWPSSRDQYIEVDFDCIDPSTFDFYWESYYLTGTTECDPQVKVYGPNNFYTLPEDSDECILMEDVYFEVSGITFGNEDTVDDGDPCTDCPPYNTDWPLNIFINCVGGYNESISGHTYTVDHVSGCTFVIYDVRENDIIDISITDAANCDQKVRIEGLQQKFEWDPVDGDDVTTSRSHFLQYSFDSYYEGDDPENSTPSSTLSGITYCDNYSGYTLQPMVQYRPTFDYGIRQGSKVIKLSPDSCTMTFSINESGTTINDVLTTIPIETWRDIEDGLENGSLIKINAEDVRIGDVLLSASYKNCPFSSEDFRNAVLEGYSFTFDYKAVVVTNKDCLGSTKINKINERFSVLPNTRLWVMTQTMDNGLQGETWRFIEKYPEDLYVRPETPEACCSHEIGYVESGDFVFNEFGFPIEVTSLNLEYCERDLFYHLNVNVGSAPVINCTDVILFNGDVDDTLLLSHHEQIFETLDLSTQQFFQDTLDCADMPPIEELERDLTGLEDCDNNNVFRLKHYTSGEIKYGELNEQFNVGDIVTVVEYTTQDNSLQRVSPGKECWEIIGITYNETIDYQLVEICTDLLTPTPSPTSTPTPTPSPTTSPTPTPTPTISPTPTSTPTPSPSPTNTPTPTSTETPTPTPTNTPTPTSTETPTPTPTPTNSPTPSPTPTSSPTSTPTSTPTPTPSPTPDCDFDVDIVVVTPTPTPTSTSTPTPTPTPNCDFDVDVNVVTPTPTPTSTSTPTPTPTPDCDFDIDINVVTPTPTPTPTATENCDFDVDINVVTPTPTPTPTATENCDFDVDINVVTPTPTPTSTPSPTPTATENCDFDIDINVVTPTPTPSPSPSPSPTPTPNCDFDVDIVVVTPTPTPSPTGTPTPTPTPNCDFDVDIVVVTPTPTPSPSGTPTPTPTPNCDFDVDIIVVTPTPTPSPTSTETPTPTPTNTPTPTPTPNCDFDVDVNVVTPTPTPSPSPTPTNTPTPSPTPSSTPTPTPSPTPNCDFDVDINVVTPTPTPSPTSTPTPTPSPSPTPSSTPTPTPTPTPNCDFDVDVDVNNPNCPVTCTTTITTIGNVSTSLSGSGIYDLGGYCNEVRDGSNNVTSTNGQEWWYDSNDCLVSTRSYSGGFGSTCIGQQVTPVGTEVSSFVHTDGTLTPSGTNKLYDSDIRYIDGNNQAIVIVTEWNSTLTSLLKVHILCDCSFDGSANEFIGE